MCPQAFKKKVGSEFGFDYYANRKVWMENILFILILNTLLVPKHEEKLAEAGSHLIICPT